MHDALQKHSYPQGGDRPTPRFQSTATAYLKRAIAQHQGSSKWQPPSQERAIGQPYGPGKRQQPTKRIEVKIVE